MTGFDPDRVSRSISAALGGPGGIALVVNVFTGVAGVVRTPARRGMFSSQPERVQIGDWRYEVATDGRLSASQVVNGIVLAEEVLAAGSVGPHIARALGQVVGRYGATVVPSIDAAVEVLDTTAGSGW